MLQSSGSLSRCRDHHFSFPSLLISTNVGSPSKSSTWSFSSQIYDQLCLQSFCAAQEDEILLPNFSPSQCAYTGQVEHEENSSFTEDDLTTEVSESSTEDEIMVDSDSETDTSNSSSSISPPSHSAASTPEGSFRRTRFACDDASLWTSATQSVDLFSHPWSLEDLRSSRKEIRSHRDAYSNHARLEYMLWRAWTKVLKDLETIAPDRMDWYVVFFPSKYNNCVPSHASCY
jgi:hypothetical protein